jgi:hypothetical protein
LAVLIKKTVGFEGDILTDPSKPMVTPRKFDDTETEWIRLDSNNYFRRNLKSIYETKKQMTGTKTTLMHNHGWWRVGFGLRAAPPPKQFDFLAQANVT